MICPFSWRFTQMAPAPPSVILATCSTPELSMGVARQRDAGRSETTLKAWTPSISGCSPRGSMRMVRGCDSALSADFSTRLGRDALSSFSSSVVSKFRRVNRPTSLNSLALFSSAHSGVSSSAAATTKVLPRSTQASRSAASSDRTATLCGNVVNRTFPVGSSGRPPPLNRSNLSCKAMTRTCSASSQRHAA